MKATVKLLLAALLAMAVLITTPSVAGATSEAARSSTQTIGADTVSSTGSQPVAAPVSVVSASTIRTGTPGAQVNAGVCLANWLSAYGCVQVAVEFGRTVWRLLTLGRTCLAYRTEYLINSSNGSVTGTRKVCTRFK